MPIIRVTKKQIEEANKAREAALKKDDDFRRFEERRQRFLEAAKAREAALQKVAIPPPNPEPDQGAPAMPEFKVAAVRNEEQAP